MQTTELTELLIEATEPQNRSLLPNDLQVSTRILTTVLEVLEDNENATTNLVYILHDLLQLLTKKVGVTSVMWNFCLLLFSSGCDRHL